MNASSKNKLHDNTTKKLNIVSKLPKVVLQKTCIRKIFKNPEFASKTNSK